MSLALFVARLNFAWHSSWPLTIISTPLEVIGLFDCALCFWVILKYSPAPIASGSLRATIDDSITRDARDWVDMGGDVLITGLGLGSLMTYQSVLDVCSKRLGMLSWGLAGRYRTLLRNLMHESP